MIERFRDYLRNRKTEQMLRDDARRGRERAQLDFPLSPRLEGLIKDAVSREIERPREDVVSSDQKPPDGQL